MNKSFLLYKTKEDYLQDIENLDAPYIAKIIDTGELFYVSSSGGSGGNNGGVANLIVETTYSELKTLRDEGNLIPGVLYRITDYVTTTAQEDTQSANHPFDIIVEALSNDALSENARAIRHEGDTYFENCNLEVWEIKYDIENNDVKYAWADTENGKGVIYYMKDEWGNECPYDFKNVQFKRWAVDEVTSTKLNQEALANLNEIFVYDGNAQPFRFAYQSSNCSYGNTTHVVNANNYDFYFTFTTFAYDGNSYSSTIEDASIKGNHFYNDEGGGGCVGNSIKPYRDNMASDRDKIDGSQFLNNIVFYGYYETEGDYPYAYHAFSNTIGYNSYNNTFRNSCGSNTFGNSCNSNTFGNSCGNNTFGNNVYSNTFGNHFQNNTFGNNCNYNTFGNNVYSNTFGNSCGNNTFGNYFQNNTFGNDCYNNTFGNSCSGNTFGNYCQQITFAKDYMYYNIVENGNQYITVTSNQTTSGSNVLRNITISQGVNNSTSAKTISHNTVNDTFKTVYLNSNSAIVNV